MESSKVANRDGKAFRTHGVNEEHSFIDDRYEIEIYSGNEISPTGHLVIASLRPNKNSDKELPEFVMRWDEKDNALDVDPSRNATKDEIKEFEKGTNEFRGHHTKKLESDRRIFETVISWKSEKLYSGRIGFSLGREVVSSVTLGLRATASSVKETSKKSGFSEQHIRHLLAKGNIKGKRLGRDWAVFDLNYKRKRRPKGINNNETS